MRVAYFGLGGLALLLVAGCGKDMGVIPDSQEFLASMGGPNITGMDETMLKSAQSAEAAGDYRQAAQYYQQLSDKNPDIVQYKVGLADAFRRGGDMDRALATYDTALATDKQSIAAKEGKALALLQKGDFDTAEKMLGEIRASGKASWRTYNALGVLTASRQSPAQAKPFFDEALRASPNNSSIMNNMGLTLALAKDFDGAAAMLTQASQLSVSKPPVKKQIDLNLALVYASAGKLENAEAIARQYFDGAALSNNLGFYAYLANDESLAKTYLNMALSQSKTFYQRAWNNLEAVNAPKRSDEVKTGKVLKVDGPENQKAPEAIALTPPPAPPATLALPPAAPAPAAIVAAPPPAKIATPLPPPAPPTTLSVPPPAPAPAQPLTTGGFVVPPGMQAVPLDAAPSAPPPPSAGNAAPATPANAKKPAPKSSESGFESLGNWVGSLVD